MSNLAALGHDQTLVPGAVLGDEPRHDLDLVPRGRKGADPWNVVVLSVHPNGLGVPRAALGLEPHQELQLPSASRVVAGYLVQRALPLLPKPLYGLLVPPLSSNGAQYVFAPSESEPVLGQILDDLEVATASRRVESLRVEDYPLGFETLQDIEVPVSRGKVSQVCPPPPQTLVFVGLDLAGPLQVRFRHWPRNEGHRQEASDHLLLVFHLPLLLSKESARHCEGKERALIEAVRDLRPHVRRQAREAALQIVSGRESSAVGVPPPSARPCDSGIPLSLAPGLGS